VLFAIMDAKNKSSYLRRILQEQEAGRNAACWQARERHEELASAYQLSFRSDDAAVEAILFKEVDHAA